MKACELRDIFISAEFKQDLLELSSYLTSIKQERPIIYCLAKQLWKRRIRFQLEAKRTDLVVDGKRVEFKFTYDCDMGVLRDELENAGENLLRDVCAEKPTHGWIQLPRLYTDMVSKGAEVFVWIILSRDLSNLDQNSRARICVSATQKKWNDKHSYLDREYLTIADQFLEKVSVERSFSVVKEEIQATGDEVASKSV